MIRYVLPFMFLFASACNGGGSENDEINAGIKAISLCSESIKENTGKDLSQDADHIYVHIFKDGYGVTFMHGAIGFFGKRSSNSYTVWGCGVARNEVVFLGAPFKDVLIDKEEKNSFEDYNQSVRELLFKRRNDKFEYCCSQKFDENNIKKHNPDFPRNTDKVG